MIFVLEQNPLPLIVKTILTGILNLTRYYSISIFFYFASLTTSAQAFANLPMPMSCQQITTSIDSIFTNELEETKWTRNITPDLYEQMLSQKCDGLAKILTLAGILYYNDNALIKARHALEKADSLFQLDGIDNSVYVRSQLFRGLINLHEKNTPQAIFHFKRAVELSQQIDFPIGEIQGNVNQALVHLNDNQIQLAKEYLLQARELTSKSRSDIINGYVYLNLGRLFVKENEYSLATLNFDTAKNIWDNIQYTKGLYFLESNYATLERSRGQLSDYENHLKKALILLEQDRSITRSGTYIDLGYHYIQKGKEEEAILYLEKALENNEAYDEKEYVNLVSRLLGLYGKRNDIDNIRKVNEKVLTTYRHKFENISYQANKWNAKEFILESKIIENKHLLKSQREAANKILVRNILLTLLAATFGLAGFIVYIKMKSNRLKEQLRIEQLRTKISKDLHDDVGTILVGISMQSQILALKKGAEQDTLAKSIAQKSAEAVTLMRDMVWAMDARNNSFTELEYKMKDYLATIQSSSGMAFSFNNSVPEKLSLLNSDLKHTVYLIFKESINNEVKHSDASFADINLSIENKHLRLTIQDNGSEKIIHKSGQGLQNMAERAESLHGTFRFDYKEGYRTEVSIPLSTSSQSIF